MKKIVFPMLLTATLVLSACDKTSTPESVKTQVEQQASAPIAANDLSAETKAYQQWVEGQIDLLLSDTEKFVAALNAGNVAEAKRIYPAGSHVF